MTGLLVWWKHKKILPFIQKKYCYFSKAKKKENQSLHFDVKFILKSKVNNFISSRIN